MSLQRIVIASAVAAALALLFLLPRVFERDAPPTVAPIELQRPDTSSAPKAPRDRPRRRDGRPDGDDRD